MCIFIRCRSRTELAFGVSILMIWSIGFILIVYHNFISHKFVPVFTQDMQYRKKFMDTRGQVMQVVHIDLKGSPPTMEYLRSLMVKLSKARVHAVMIEYDDMFPYQGPLKELSALSAFSIKEITDLVQLCQSYQIEVIPMIQTFGHLEHALKLHTFKKYREVLTDNRVICPMYPGSLKLVRIMIEQIMHLHPYSRRIHIGCDKIDKIKKCDICYRNRRSADKLFIDYVKAVATFIRRTYSNKITTLMWDNMLRPMSSFFLKESKLQNLLEIVINIPDRNSFVSQSVREELWPKYNKVFKKIWFAGAFRGADGNSSLLPKLEARNDNQDAWLDFIFEDVERLYSPRVKIAGYILTGSSKADHFASSVDLLPISEPSLLFNTLKMAHSVSLIYEFTHMKVYNEILECEPAVTASEIFNWQVLVEKCNFETKLLLNYTLQFLRFQSDVDKVYINLYENNSWITPYHVKHNFINVAAFEDPYYEQHFYFSFFKLYSLLEPFKNEMKKFFKEQVVEEWFQMHVEPFEDKVKTLQNVAVASLKLDFFPRRE